jgi:hypothetical protein
MDNNYQYKYKYIKYKQKYLVQKGGGCTCGRNINYSLTRCCYNCDGKGSSHTTICDNNNPCVCKRKVNTPYNTCCQACRSLDISHTIACNNRNNIITSPAPFKKPTPPPFQKPTSTPFKKPTPPPFQKPTSTPFKKPKPPPFQKPTSTPFKKPKPPPFQKPTSTPFQKPTPTPQHQPTPTPQHQPTLIIPKQKPLLKQPNITNSIPMSDDLFYEVGSDHLPILFKDPNNQFAILSFNVLKYYANHHDNNMNNQDLPNLKTNAISLNNRITKNIHAIQYMLDNYLKNIPLILLCVQESHSHFINELQKTFNNIASFPTIIHDPQYEQPILILKNDKKLHATLLPTISLGGSKNATIIDINNIIIVNTHLPFQGEHLLSKIKSNIQPNNEIYLCGDLNIDSTKLEQANNNQFDILDDECIIYKGAKKTHKNISKNYVTYDHIIKYN